MGLIPSDLERLKPHGDQVLASLPKRRSPQRQRERQTLRAAHDLPYRDYLVVYPPLTRIVWPVIHQPSETKKVGHGFSLLEPFPF